MKYFAYGSNMDVEQMDDRCPGAIVLSTAKLIDHRFIINSRGVASIVHTPGDFIWGVLWEIGREDERALDHYEGVAVGLYSKTTVTVETGIGSVENALTYVAADPHSGPPRSGYMERIVAAAAGHGLPNDYVAALEDWVTSGYGPL